MNTAQVQHRDARLDVSIFMPLARVRRRCRLYLALEGLVRLSLALIGASLAQLLVDRWLNLQIEQRATINVVITMFWLWIIYVKLVRPLAHPLVDHALATAVDRTHPQLHDQIVTAVQFAGGEVGAPESNSPQLVRAVLDDACQSADQIEFLNVLNHRRAAQRLGEMSFLIALVALSFVLMPDLMGTWFGRNWLAQDRPWPQNTHLRPRDFDAFGERRVPRGDELEIVALNQGRVPTAADLHWWTDSGRSGEEPMTLVGQTNWHVSLGILTEDVFFRITGGDERTRDYMVRVVERPRIIHTTATITPPAYTGLEPIQLEQQTSLELLSGSLLEIAARLNKPVRSAQFVGADGPAAACVLEAGYVRLSWNEPISGSYAFELVDGDQWTNRRPVRYTLKIVPDHPPAVNLELIGVGDSITPQAVLPIELTIRDDYGLGDATLLVQRDDHPPIAVALDAFDPGRRSLRSSLQYAVASLPVTAGETLRIWAEASDQDPAGPNAGRTEPIVLRVLTPMNLLRELAEREMELRQEFERLLSAQRGLKDALDRLLGELPSEGRASRSQSQQLAGLSRRQQNTAARVQVIEEGFQEILEQMRTSHIARATQERRIRERIADPLARLGGQMMPRASSEIGDLRRSSSREQKDHVAGEQMEVLGQMRSVLANMKEFEGFREVVTLLEEIISEQGEIRDETLDAVRKQIEDLLDLDDLDETPPPISPKP